MRRLNAYFPMSTANPTGQRPWNFAMQDRAMGFYVNNGYPLPAKSLGRLAGIPSLAISKLTGKNSYGLPQPVYTPLSRNFLNGLGVDISSLTAAQIARMTGVIQGSPAPYQPPPSWVSITPTTNQPTNTLRRWNNPNATSSSSAQPTTAQLQNQLAQSQQTVAQLTAQQEAYNMAQANGTAVTAAGTPIASSTTSAPVTTDWTTWFTDPTQEVISGFPNWAVVGAGALAFFWFTGKRR